MRSRLRFVTSRILCVLLLVCAGQPSAQEMAWGPVTQLPLPRYVSIKAAEANARRGPSRSHRIDWVFQRRHLPVEITAEYGHWRRIRDMEGAGGWVHYSLLSGVRFVVVTAAPSAALRADPAADAPTVAEAETAVVARLGACVPDWCEVTADRWRGWVEKSQLWGVRADEVRD